MSTPTTRYDIIVASTAQALQDLVQPRLSQGWQLQGEVCVSMSESDEFRYEVWAQAMTLAETPQPT